MSHARPSRTAPEPHSSHSGRPSRGPAWRALRAGLFTLLALAAPAHPRADSCCGLWPVTQMSSPQGPSWIQPHLASDEVGGVIAAWTHADLGLMVSGSADDGETWSPPRALSPLSNLYDLAMAPDGHALVCWSARDIAWCAASDDQGLTFADPVAAGFGALDDWSMRPSVSMTAGGHATCVFSDGDSLQAACSTDFGASWQPQATIAFGLGWIITGPWGDQSFSRAYEGLTLDGASVVAYTIRTPDESRLWLARTDGPCGPWLPAVPGSDEPIDPLDGIRLATTDDSNLTAAWHGRPASGQEARVRAWSSLGATAEGEIVLGPVEPSYSMSMAAAEDGRVAVAWVDDAFASSLQVSTDRGLPGSWRATPSTFASEGRASQWHRVALRPDGPVFVVWADFRGAEACGHRCEEIYLNATCDDGDTWLAEDQRLDSDEPPWGWVSHWPQIALGSSGRVHVAWDERGDGSGTGVIHYEGLDPAPPALDGAPIGGPLRVARSGAGVSLSWSDDSVATAYDVYTGTLAGLYEGRAHDHASAACHVPRSGVPPEGAVLLDPLPGGSTILVVPAACVDEGGAGRSSLGSRRPVSPVGPPCGPAG